MKACDFLKGKLWLGGQMFECLVWPTEGELALALPRPARALFDAAWNNRASDDTSLDCEGRNYSIAITDYESPIISGGLVVVRLKVTGLEKLSSAPQETKPKTGAEQRLCTQCGLEIPRGYMVRAADDAPCCSTDCVQVRNRLAREEPLVALVSAVPAGLDPVGWRAVILGVREWGGGPNELGELGFEPAIFERAIRLFLGAFDGRNHAAAIEAATCEKLPPGTRVDFRAHVIGLYVRATRPAKPVVRPHRLLRDVGPRLTVDIDDGRDE